MKFMRTYNIPNESWDKAVSRFLKTGGPAPEGAKLLVAATASSWLRAMTSPPSTGSRPSGTMSATW